MVSILLALASLATSVHGLDSAGWRSQSIYQVLTDRFALESGSTTTACDVAEYCGGTWQALISKLDYIQDMGFTAIWISPVVENLQTPNGQDGDSYHGYWATNIYNVNTNFGTASDLVALSDALHDRKMYLMVDVVTNHMAYDGCGTCVDYSTLTPFNKQSYYHDFCLIDYDDPTSTQVCWAGDNNVALPDLRTEDSDVMTIWQSWVAELVANYTIDGLRIDSSAEVDQCFFPSFQDAAGVYAVGEVLNGSPTTICPYQEYLDGVLNYPAFFWITQAFESSSGDMGLLSFGIDWMLSECSDTTLLGSFLENHDNPRFPSLTSDVSLAKNAIAFTMLADGIPIIYEGQEQHLSGGSVPVNREAIWTTGYSTTSTLYTFITTLNKLRTQVSSLDSTYLTSHAYPAYSDTSSIVMHKGATGKQVVGVFTNVGASGSHTLSLNTTTTGFTASEQVVDLLTCTTATTDSSGTLAVSLSSGLPQVWYPSSALSSSGFCSSTTGSTSRASCTAVAVTFVEKVTTTMGQTIKLSGSVSQLGSWATGNAITLSAANYTTNNPIWFATVSFPPGTVIEYKFINVGGSGSVTWEDGSNRAYTVASSCQSTATVSSTWQ